MSGEGDDGYLGFLWNHVLCGSQLVAIEATPKGQALVFRSSELLRGKIGSATVRVALVDKAPLELGDLERCENELEPAGYGRGGEAARISLAQLLSERELFVPTASPNNPLYLAWSADAEPSLRIVSSLRFAAFTTENGKRVSEMKAYSLGKASALLLQGLVDTPVLLARRDEAIGQLVPLLGASGFIGAAPFWFRAEPSASLGIELVNSRWNTHLGVAFRFVFHRAAGDHRGRSVRSVLAMYGLQAGNRLQRAAAQLEGPEDYRIEQDTNAASLGLRLKADFERLYLPWVERALVRSEEA